MQQLICICIGSALIGILVSMTTANATAGVFTTLGVYFLAIALAPKEK